MNIKIKEMKITNFMNTHDDVFKFYDKSIVKAQNGKGKSTLMNAFSWLMFDTDSELHNNPSIRRMINGQPVNDIDVSVECVMEMDGREAKVKKVQKRTFKKDGTSYSDDNTYFINDVPKTLKAFKEYFGDVKLMQMCSNPIAFISKKDKDMREYIFSKIENVTDIQIASADTRLSCLTSLLEQYSREEIEALNKASIKKCNENIPILKGQIMEKQRDITANSDINISDLELHRNAIKEQIAANIANQSDIEKQNEEYNKISKAIYELNIKLSEIEKDENEKLNSARKEKEHEKREYETKLHECEDNIHVRENIIAKCEKIIAECEEKRKEFANKWTSISNEEFDESTTICPTCHRELPKDEVEKIRNNFTENKNKRLKEIEEAGNKCKSDKINFEQQMEKAQEELTALIPNKEELESQIKAIADSMVDIKLFADMTDNAEYNKVKNELKDKEKELSDKKNNNLSELKIENQKLNDELRKIEVKIQSADTSKDEERLEELKNQIISLEQAKTDAEKILDLLKELDKVKNEKLSDNINSMFSLVKWKLFNHAKNGNYTSVCVPMVDNKSILSLESNKGNIILGKADILNSFQRIENMQVPVFMDDVESLDSENLKKLISMFNCQLICLQVANNDNIEIEEL